MNKLLIKILFLTFSVAGIAIGGGIVFSRGWYGLTLVGLLIIIYLSYRLYNLNLKTTRQFKGFVDSIRFSDNSIAFHHTLSDKIYEDYYNRLDATVKKLNRITQKRESEMSFYNNLLNRIDFALIVTDNDYKIVWINKMALDMLGRPKPDHINQFENVSEELTEVCINLSPGTSKTVKIARGGKVKNITVNLSLISVRNNNFKVYSLKDVQPVVEETENVAWQQLISVLTHEMMNSLTPIISLADTFSEPDADYDAESMMKAMNTIHRRSKGLVEFVSNYKKLTQIPQPRKESFLVKQWIEDVVNLFTANEIKIKYMISASDGLTIYADRALMEQVLINLIKNATEACGDMPEPEIKLSVMEYTGKQVMVSVSDNGPGIAPEVMEKIFMPFYTTRPHGSGIGLSICRRIIELHGGTITVASSSLADTTFTIRCPL